MRQGIMALESRLAELQGRADSGQFKGARLDKIQNRIGRLYDMGATGQREIPQQVQPQAPRPMATPQAQPTPQQQPINDLVARPGMVPPMAAPRPMQRPSLFSMYQQQGQPMPGGLPPPFGRNMFNTRRE